MKKFIFIALALGLVAAGTGFYMYNKPHKDMSKAKPAFSVTATELMAEYQNDEQAANDKYLGKVIEVSGKISSIVPGEDETMQVMLETDEMLASISCNMQNPRDEVLATNIKKGNRITIKGQCSGSLMDVIMDRCVIVQ